MSYIKIERKILDWEWFDDSNMLKLWLYILLSVNYKDKKWKGVVVEKGSFITSINNLCQQTKMTPQTLRTCLSRLKSTNEITIKSTNKYTQIYVNKWEEYQCFDDETNKLINKQTNNQLTNNQQTTNKQLTTTKEDIRNKEYKKDIIYSSFIIIKNRYIEAGTIAKNRADQIEMMIDKGIEKNNYIPETERLHDLLEILISQNITNEQKYIDSFIKNERLEKCS